jgi:hypothetical protein
MMKAVSLLCRECGANVERRDRCLTCGARWPHLTRDRVRVHNCAACVMFALLLVVTVAATWAAAQL